MINVINNYLDNNVFYTIKNIMFSNKFPWTFRVAENLKFLQFFHNFISTNKNKEREVSPFMSPILSYFLKQLKVKKVSNSEVIMISQTNENNELPCQALDPKIINTYRAILCLNTCNSDIQISGGDKVEFVENRLIMFPSSTSYSLTTPNNKNYASWIVIDYTK